MESRQWWMKAQECMLRVRATRRAQALERMTKIVYAKRSWEKIIVREKGGNDRKRELMNQKIRTSFVNMSTLRYILKGPT